MSKTDREYQLENTTAFCTGSAASNQSGQSTNAAAAAHASPHAKKPGKYQCHRRNTPKFISVMICSAIIMNHHREQVAHLSQTFIIFHRHTGSIGIMNEYGRKEYEKNPCGPGRHDNIMMERVRAQFVSVRSTDILTPPPARPLHNVHIPYFIQVNPTRTCRRIKSYGRQLSTLVREAHQRRQTHATAVAVAEVSCEKVVSAGNSSVRWPWLLGAKTKQQLTQEKNCT